MGRSGLVVCLVLGACSFELSSESVPDADTGSDGGGDAPITEVDAAFVECPPTYTAGYRLDATLQTWLVAEAACEADVPGHTHLVVIETEEERVVVGELVQALPGDAWVGVVRDPGGDAPWPWRYVTGGAASFAPFEALEPNNMSGDQFTVVLRKGSRFLYDYGVAQQVHAICECDHRPPINADYDPGT